MVRSNTSNKMAIVILNYQNSDDALNCVKSIYRQNYVELAGIVVVDNDSSRENYNILKNGHDEMRNFSLIRLPSNLGFAKGNNVGIQYARNKYHTNNIFVVNNDILFTDPDILRKLLIHVKPGVGMIAPQIRLKNGYIQKRYKQPMKYPYIFYKYISLIAGQFDMPELIEKMREKYYTSSGCEEILHGSAILFTPAFFQFYSGIYSKTFLYYEEVLLKIQLEKVGLRQEYVSDTEILHLEDQSSNMCFDDIDKWKLHYLCKSYKHIFLATALPYPLLRKLC